MQKALPLALAALGPFVLACGGGAGETPPLAAGPAAPAGPVGTASISGSVLLSGPPPAPRKVKLSGDPHCEGLHKGGLLIHPVRVGPGNTLADVLVYVKSGISAAYAAPAEAARLDQKDCVFVPHVLAVQTGQPIRIHNSDDTLHNVHSHTGENNPFNIGQRKKGAEFERTFDRPELKVVISCDVHSWMRSYVHVLPHPFFAVTREDGGFEIKGLPAGDYEIEALHGAFPPMSRKVPLKDGEALHLELTLNSERRIS